MTSSLPHVDQDADVDQDGPATLDSIARAVEDLAQGRPVVVVDAPDRENEGDLIVPAQTVTAEQVAFMMTECRGLICAPMAGGDLDRLGLPQMVPVNTEPLRTAFTVSVDAARGVGTGISAADRAATIRLLADPGAAPGDLVRPGHVFPLRAKPGGVLERLGHTEAAVDLVALAGLRPAAAIVEIARDDGAMARLPDLLAFARRHGFAIISIADLAAYRRATRALAEAPDSPTTTHRLARVQLPTAYGDFVGYGYRSEPDGAEHVALVAGDIGDGADVLVRVHSECLTGDVFGSLRCDCGPQLQESLRRVADAGRGVVVYLRGHEGRGIGLISKLRAYELQEHGRDTLEANLDLGLPVDARDYRAAAGILTDLGVRSVRLLTNNPAKGAALAAHGIEVLTREPLPTLPGPYNLRYLRTKRDRMGHELPWLDLQPDTDQETR